MLDYPETVPAVRVLNARFVEGTKDIEHLVQRWQGEGIEPSIEWMSIEAWRKLVGISDAVL